MKNVTIALDDALLREARRLAAARATSVNAMIRAFLEQETQRESETVQARRRIVEMCRGAEAEVGQRTWSRDDVHAR
jgi:hypothetical protein